GGRGRYGMTNRGLCGITGTTTRPAGAGTDSRILDTTGVTARCERAGRPVAPVASRCRPVPPPADAVPATPADAYPGVAGARHDRRRVRRGVRVRAAVHVLRREDLPRGGGVVARRR